MNNIKVLGITLAVIGAVLLVVGYRASGTPVDQLSDTFTGSYTDRTMLYLIAGVAAVVGGGLLAAFGARSK
jgi:drug/metabolite transporter (DMT)-like permease